MKGYKVEDYPPHVQAQIRAQLGDYARPPAAPTKPAATDPLAHITSTDPLGLTSKPRVAKKRTPPKARQPNKTEAAYADAHLRGIPHRFEPLTFRMANGHKYTPDWVTFTPEGLPKGCVEVKGGYALHSEQRARLAFDQCAQEFPGLTWTWARKTKTGWEITDA